MAILWVKFQMKINISFQGTPHCDLHMVKLQENKVTHIYVWWYAINYAARYHQT